MDDLLTDALRRLLTDQCTPRQVRAAEAGEQATALWHSLAQAGFADALLSEDQGGAGLRLAEVFPLMELCGYHAVPLPLPQTMLARALLAQAGVAAPPGPIAIASAAVQEHGRVSCPLVPFGRTAETVLLTLDGATRLLPASHGQVSPAVFALDAHLQWDIAAWQQGTPVPGMHELQTLQACCAAAQIAGALMSLFHRTLQYANERQQFGRPIGKFQAIQHQISVLAEHSFAARMAAQIGCSAASWQPGRLQVAIAKARTSEAAVEGAAIAHAIHGAIGFTAEFDLQLYTRRLHAWRQQAGSESYWHGVLGEALTDHHHGIALDLMREASEPL